MAYSGERKRGPTMSRRKPVPPRERRRLSGANLAKLVDDIVAAIETAEKAGRSRYAIAKSAGVAYSVISRLISRERGVSIDTLEKLASELGYDIALQKQAKKR